MQRNFLIRDLYYNDAKMPFDEFQVEKDLFVLKQIGNCTLACIVDKSWDTEKEAEESSKESHTRITTYFALCALSSYNHPKIELFGIPCEINDKDALNQLVQRGEARRRGQESMLDDDEKFNLRMITEDVLPAKEKIKATRRVKQSYKKYLYKTRALYKQYLPVVSKSEPLLTATEYYLRTVALDRLDFSQLIDAMISLEALFNDGPEKISFKLRTRGGALMALRGFDYNQATKQLQMMYDERSKIVHGKKESIGPRHEVWDMMELQEDIENYTATCLRYFYILAKNRIKKKDIREAVLIDLDKCLGDEKLRNSMKQEIASGIKQFDAVMYI